MKRVAAATVPFLLFGFFGACGGGGDDPPPLDDPYGSSGGRPPDGSGGNAGEAPDSIYAPVVEIVSPETDDEPTASNVLTSGKVEVTCSATRSPEDGAFEVDEGEVRISSLDADGEPIQDPLPASPIGDDEYSAELTLPANLENGTISISCSAADIATPQNIGSTTEEFFVDNGPEITVVTPEDDAAKALTAPVRFEFRAEPWPLVEDDPGAEVVEVTLEVNGEFFDLTEDDPGTFSVSIDFQDSTIFPDVPSGNIPVVIRATNDRGIERTLSYSFTLDGEGPVISINSPANEEVVAKEVTLRFTVHDALTGINPDTVVVELGTTEYPFDPDGEWTQDGENFTFTFDTTKIDSDWQVTINIRAEDLVGNASDLGDRSQFLYLDNHPPLVDLDPSLFRDVRDERDPIECSVRYDPVGEAVNDGDAVTQNALIRTMVWDRTNDFGQPTLHYAGVDRSSVVLYIQPDSATGVLEDTSGDGACDEIYDRNNLNFEVLKAIPRAGAAKFDANEDLTLSPTLNGCSPGSTTNPARLCSGNASDMIKVLDRALPGGTEPAIYALGDLDQPECTGAAWDLTDFMDGTEGWVCLASRALDNAGNVGVSPPLRLCVDDPGIAGTPDCSEDTMPTCRVDNCESPPVIPSMLIDID